MPFKVPLGEQEIPRQDGELTPDEQEMLRALAQKVVDWHMTVPAILTLESVKPLNWIGSQAMVFFEPFVTAIFSKPLSIKNYNLFRQMMERRENVERLLQKIEELDAIQLEQEREQKRKLKAERKIKRKRFWRKLLGREKPEDLNPPKV
jgi:hypothetical protein